MNTTILRLREEESTPTIHNGTYTTTLSKPIVIEEGDSIQIKSAFIDTASESTVTVDEDFTATLTTAKYFTNHYLGTDVSVNNPLSEGSGMTFTDDKALNLAGPDNKKYWSCQTNPSNLNNHLLLSITVFPIKEKKFGDLHFNMLVRDPLQPTATATFVPIKQQYIPPLHWKDYKSGGYKHNVDVWVNVPPGTDPALSIQFVPFKGDFKGDWAGHNMYVPLVREAIFSTTLQSENFLTLITDTCEIPIKKGEYTPTELATLMTDQMSLLVRPGGTVGNNYAAVPSEFLVDSPFLSSTKQHYQKALLQADNTYPAQGVSNDTTIYISEDGNALFSNWRLPTLSSAASDNLLGTNNASLNFDTTLNKLNFDVLHFPVLVPDGSPAVYIPGIVYTPDQADTTATKFPHDAVTSYSGVGIVEFSPAPFWQNLGFTGANTISVVQNPTELFNYSPGFYWNGSENLPLTPPTRAIHRITVGSQVGKSTTSQYAGMDLVVNNTAATWMNPYENTAGVASSITNPMVGDRQFNGSANNDGYLMINIGVKIPQTMVASTQAGVVGSNQCQSIVGKFYTSGNILQDQGEGSIAYTHVGEPQILSSLDVQILNGDGTIPINTDIGPNNTIFLELVKAPRAEPAP